VEKWLTYEFTNLAKESYILPAKENRDYETFFME